MLIGSGAGWLEVDVCKERSVAHGFDRETPWQRRAGGGRADGAAA